MKLGTLYITTRHGITAFPFPFLVLLISIELVGPHALMICMSHLRVVPLFPTFNPFLSTRSTTRKYGYYSRRCLYISDCAVNLHQYHSCRRAPMRRNAGYTKRTIFICWAAFILLQGDPLRVGCCLFTTIFLSRGSFFPHYPCLICRPGVFSLFFLYLASYRSDESGLRDSV